MANWLKAKTSDQFQIIISRFKTENYYAEYEITLKCQHCYQWRMYKRYSDFDKLNDEMTRINDRYKVYFPPKKSFNNMSSTFLNNRRKALELYLNELVGQCGQYLPRSLAYFLEMDKYEIHGITTAAARTLFAYGNTLLEKNNFFEIPVLLIHSINQRMSSPVPTNLYQKQDEDFGNVLDVLESLKKVKIIPYSANLTPDSYYGSSNIKVTTLTFDISIFTSVVELQMNNIEIVNLRGLYKMNSTIEKLHAHYCLKSLEDLLFADFAYKESNIEHLQKLDGPLRCATTVDLSHNYIAEIDVSIVTLRQVQNLNLSYNQLSDIQNMQHLIYLTELDLSYNNLYICQAQSFSNKLGSIKKLLLKGNRLTSLNVIDRMFSLEHLDISENLFSDSLSLLSLSRLSCLESLIIKDNPICAISDFSSLIYDIFLDRYKHVRINEFYFSDLPLLIQNNFFEYRSLTKATLFSDSSQSLSSNDLSGDSNVHTKKNRSLFSVDVSFNENNMIDLEMESILTLPSVFNIFIYWFFVATSKCISPKKLLWVTEVFAPNRSVRPSLILLVTSGTHNPNMLKCRLIKSFNPSTKKYVVTIEPKSFLDLTSDFQHMIIGANKSFIRLDISSESRDLYLCNNALATDAFICHLYHVDDGMATFGDSRIIQLNEEDRVEMMRRFIDVWRLDMLSSMRRNQENTELHIEIESELLFISRAMLQMKNGFQILLTVVVTQELMYLVDERIYDWPDFNKHPNLSELWSGNSCSPYTSSSNYFPFLRTNAYSLRHIDTCSKMETSECPVTIIEQLCPLFRYAVQITFNSDYQSTKDPLKLLFENEQKINLICQVIHQQCASNKVVELTPIIHVETTSPNTSTSDLPCHLRHMLTSYTEIRLSLSLSFPKLFHLAQCPPQDILSFYHSLLPHIREDKVSGLVWSKIIKVLFDVEGAIVETKELPGLICVSSCGIYVIYEVEEDDNVEGDGYSDPEVDQPDSNGPTTKWQTIVIYVRDIFKVYVGLKHQWLTICSRKEDGGSETDRLVLMIRNKSLCKHIINWINVILSEHCQSEVCHSVVTAESAHHNSDVKELLYEIQRTSMCGEIELIHYSSLDDIRFDTSLPCQSINIRCDAVFSNAIVVTSENIALIRHNVCEYPVREFAAGTVRQSPRHLQYQILKVIPLFDCLQLQLPGHDRSVLIVVIKSSSQNLRYSNSFKIQLSINCQKEQKRLIDKLRHQRSKFLQIDTPLRVSVC